MPGRHCDHWRQAGKNWNEKPRGCARTSPPHVKTRRAPNKRGDDEEQNGREKPLISAFEHHPGPGGREQVDRAVEEEAEFLIEEQPQQTTRNVFEAHVRARVRAVRRLWIEDTVDYVKRIQPQACRDDDGRRKRGQERNTAGWTAGRVIDGTRGRRLRCQDRDDERCTEQG